MNDDKIESTGILMKNYHSKNTGTPIAVDETLLKEEYFHLQNVVEESDSRVLSIKAWSVTLSMAGIGAAYFQVQPFVLLLASVSALLFWVIEALWKTFQYANYNRLYEIEQYFSGDSETILVPRITHSWSESWHEGGIRRWLKIMRWPHVFLPHIVVFIGGIILFMIETL